MTVDKHQAETISFVLDPMTETCLRKLLDTLPHIHRESTIHSSMGEGRTDIAKTSEALNALLNRKAGKDADGDQIWIVEIPREQAAYALPLVVMGLEGDPVRRQDKRAGRSYEENTGIVNARRVLLKDNGLPQSSDGTLESLASDTHDTLKAIAEEYGVAIPEKQRSRGSANKLHDILGNGPKPLSDKLGAEALINEAMGEGRPR